MPAPIFMLGALLSIVMPSTAQEIEWQEINDGMWGGIIKKIVPHPDGFLFALTYFGGSGEDRIYRSRDEGLSWTALDTGAPDTSIADLVIFPDGEMLASTSTGGLLRSFDDGESWIRTAEDYRFATDFALHQSGVLFVGEYDEGRVLRSADRGGTWVPTGLASSGNWFSDIVVTPTGTILAAASDNGLFRSEDLGATWTNVGFIGSYLPFVAVMADSSIFVRTGSSKYCMSHSVDDGVTWHRFACGFQDSSTGDVNVQSIAMTETGTLFVADWWRIHASQDGGLTWRLSADLEGTDLVDDSFLVFDGKVAAGTWGKGIIMTEDDGQTWDRRNYGIGAATATVIRNHPDGSLYAIARRDDLFRSEDHGATWERLETDQEKGLQWSASMVIDESGDLFSAPGLAYRSRDGGASWEELGDQCYGERLAISPDGTLYLADYNTIYRFVDADHGCEIVTRERQAIYEIAFANNGDLLVATASGYDGPEDGVFRSSDGGRTWQAMPMSPFNKSIYKILVRPNGVVIAGPLRSGIYRSDDDGYSFEVVWQPPYVGYVRDFAVSPTGDIYAATLGGVFRSTDDGWNWVDVGEGIPASRIASVNFDEAGYLYVGTEGAGIYRSANPIVVAEEGDPLPKRKDLLMPNFPNPFSEATSINFVIDRVAQIRLTIHDLLGKEIAVLAGGIYQPGEHRVAWTPVRVTSGIYLCRLEVGDSVSVRSLAVVR